MHRYASAIYSLIYLFVYSTWWEGIGKVGKIVAAGEVIPRTR